MSVPNSPPAPKNENVPATVTVQSDEFVRPASTNRAVDKIPREFGRYRLVEIVGRGGMGAVFRAHDTQLDREVALKVPFLGDDNEDTRVRFYREARAAATLQHANICPVYDVGEFQGIPYLTMAFIEGRSLSQIKKEGPPLSPPQLAVLVRKLALAMQEAHTRGVIHRDLKPANVVLRTNNEPIIMDFGLARRAGDERSHGLTQQGDIVGTVEYMSPEQVEGDINAVTPATDIYAMGVILYEMLCGRRPFDGSTTSLLVQIATKEPPRPTSINPNIPAKLEEICLKAMAKKPADRYATMALFATALAEYLRAHQTGAAGALPPAPRLIEPPSTPKPSGATEVIAEKPAPVDERPSRSRVGDDASLPLSAPKSATRSTTSKRSRSGRRKKQKQSSSGLVVALAAGGAVLAVVGLAAAAIIFWPKSETVTVQPTTTAQRSFASGPPVPPPTPPPPTRPVAPPTRPNPPAPALTAGFTLRALPDTVSLAVGVQQKVTVRIERKDYQGPIRLSWTAPKEVRVTPAGPITLQTNQSEAALTLRILSEASPESAEIKLTATTEGGPPSGTRPAVTGKVAVQVSSSPCMRVIEPNLPANFEVRTVTFTPEATLALVGGGAGRPRGPGPGPGPNPGAGPGPPGPDAGADANAIHVWNLEKGEALNSLQGHADRVTGLFMAADGKTMLSISDDLTLATWDLSQGKIKQQWPRQPAKVLTAGISADGKRGVIILPGVALKVNLENAKLPALGLPTNTAALTGSKIEDAVRTVAISPDKKIWLMGGLEGKLFICDMLEKAKPKPLAGPKEAVRCAAFAPGSRYAATGGGGVLVVGTLKPGLTNAVSVWDTSDSTMKWSSDGHTQPVVCVAFSANGKFLASGATNGEIRVWAVEDGKLIASLPGHTGPVLGVAFAADNRTLWSGSSDKTLRQWRLP